MPLRQRRKRANEARGEFCAESGSPRSPLPLGEVPGTMGAVVPLARERPRFKNINAKDLGVSDTRQPTAPVSSPVEAKLFFADEFGQIAEGLSENPRRRHLAQDQRRQTPLTAGKPESDAILETPHLLGNNVRIWADYSCRLPAVQASSGLPSLRAFG